MMLLRAYMSEAQPWLLSSKHKTELSNRDGLVYTHACSPCLRKADCVDVPSSNSQDQCHQRRDLFSLESEPEGFVANPRRPNKALFQSNAQHVFKEFAIDVSQWTSPSKPHTSTFASYKSRSGSGRFLMRILGRFQKSTFVHPFGLYNIIKALSRKVEPPNSSRNQDSIVPGPRGRTGDAM